MQFYLAFISVIATLASAAPLAVREETPFFTETPTDSASNDEIVAQATWSNLKLYVDVNYGGVFSTRGGTSMYSQAPLKF